MVVSEPRLNDLEEFDWPARIERGRGTEKRFVEHVRRELGLHIGQTSQHPYGGADAFSRHFPDMFIMEERAFVQVKDGRRSGRWPTTIGQTDSIDACIELGRMGNRVWVMWEYPDGSFHGNDVRNIAIAGNISNGARRHGSGTAAYKIEKSSLRPLRDLLDGDRP